MAPRKKKRRSKSTARARTPPARKKRSKPKPKRKPKSKLKVKRKPAKKRKPKVDKRKRSAAAKKGWEKRRKRDRLLQSMVDRSLQRMIERTPPQGPSPGPDWTRVTQLNLEHMNSQETAEQRALRLQTIKELGLEFPTRDFLYDYLAWAAEEFDADISDMYAMYFGYKIGGGETK